MNLYEYDNLISKKPIHIATVNKDNNPNLSVASNVRIIDNNKIIISANEMVNTPKNIEYNPHIVITTFDEQWNGLRLFGKAKFYTSGEYYDFCEKTFFANNKISPFGATKPKGAIVVIVDTVERLI